MPFSEIKNIVAADLVGDAWPSVSPGIDPVLYGHAELEPKGDFEVRSLQTFRLTYTVGRYGIDDTGGIRVVFRFFGDWGILQMANPQAYNYVTASTNTGAHIHLTFAPSEHQRPWFKGLTARLHGGYLKEGDTITIVFGDTSHGSPGMKMQTFVESGFEFKVLADVCAVGHFTPLSESPVIAITPGEPHLWKAVLPTLRRPKQKFHLGIKAEDRWGNPTDKANTQLTFEPSHPVRNLPSKLDYQSGQKSVCIEGLEVENPCLLTIRVFENNRCVAIGGPLLIRNGDNVSYWGDLHGQSGETIGITTASQYFDFARNKSFLDVTSHQANDFQINNAFWKYINELTSEYQEDGRFVTFPGYEWSGNTAVGGDRNVFFRHEGRQIHRSSHALLPERDDIDSDATDANALFEKLEHENCVVYAHVGGRYADITFSHDGSKETAMEIHSAWGTFEWLLTDGFKLGHRCGVVCNSDGHKGRPGASYPGAATFGAYGGLTCFFTESLTRDNIFECLKKRHHYGTTGCRLHMEVFASFKQPAILFAQDPKIHPETTSSIVNRVMMGDIVEVTSSKATLEVSLHSHAPIERIEIRNGTETVQTYRPFSEADLGSRIRIVWSGAEYRGRGRQTNWTGRAKFHGSKIKSIKKINSWNLERRLEVSSSDTVEWDAMTTGNFGGFDVVLSENESGHVDITTNHGELSLPMKEIGLMDKILDAGGLGRQVRVFRLPENNNHKNINENFSLSISEKGDNPIWICVTTEDGFQAWSSPIFVFQK